LGVPYLDLGKEIAKTRRQKVPNFIRERHALFIIYLRVSHFPTSFDKDDHRPKKIEKFDWLPGTPCKG